MSTATQPTQPQYVIVENDPNGYRAYGQALDFWRYKGSEAIIAGPAETGKTRAALQKLHGQMCKYKNAQGAIIRKTRQSMTSSVLQTFEKKVLPPDCGVTKHGGSHVEWYQYPNGSQIHVGGMDNPGKVLSSERDVIYVNQAEELELDDWETLTTRATGRAGNMPYALVMGDCNPHVPAHWILERAKAGKLRMFESRHEDNPVLYNRDVGEWTEQGKRTLSVLDSLTGVRYKRLRLGLWAGTEGAVYEEWNPAVHIIDPFPIPQEWPRYRAIDFGFTNPFSCLWLAADDDGRLFLYRELYQTQTLVSTLAGEITRLSGKERYQWTVSDHDAEDRATLHANGITTEPAPKDVSPGIQAVQARLPRARDGRPRLFIMRNALVRPDPDLKDRRLPTCTADEFPEYTWAVRPGGQLKEEPVKRNDHGLDALRYAVFRIDGPRKSKRLYSF
jgi:PBSX family phage terminase large subunit